MTSSEYRLVERFVRVILPLAALVGCVQLIGCAQKETPQQLQEQTAQATAEVKSDAKAVADGIRQGWSRDRPLDLNSASRDQLASLPGMTDVEARRVIDGRPYDEPADLVTRRIMTKSEYDRISDRVTAKR